MPKIPNAESIQRRIPSGATNIVALDNRNVSAGFSEISSGLGEIQKRKNAFETSKADLDFLTLKNKTERESELDEDYSTLDERYVGKLSGGLGELALNISDTRARADFVARHKVNIEQGRKGIQKLAFSKESDHERAGVDERLTSLREVALTGSPDDIRASKEAMTNLLDSARQLGYYSEVDVVGAKEAWRNSAAQGRLSMMEAEDQVEALKQPWAQDLPSDIRAALQKKASAVARTNKAITIVDDLLDKDLNEDEARDNFEKIKNKKLRREVEKRWDYDYNKAKKADAENQWEHKNKYAFNVLHEGFSIEEIPEDEWEDMDSDTKIYLKNLQAESVKPPTKSDPNLVLFMSELAAKGNYAEIVEIVKSPSRALSATDRVKYGKIAIDGTMPIEVDDEMKDNKAVELALASSKIDDDETITRLLVDVKEWRRKFQERTEKKPDDRERDLFIGERLLRVPLDGFFSDYEKPIFLLEPGEWKLSQEEMVDEDPEFAKLVIEFKQLDQIKENDLAKSEGRIPIQIELSQLELANLYNNRDAFKESMKKFKERERIRLKREKKPLMFGTIGEK